MDRPDVIAFDLDGTLVDSADGIRRSIALTLDDWGRGALEIPDTVIGPPLSDIFRDLGFDAGDLDAAVSTYRDHYGRVGLIGSRTYPGVRQLLDAARRRGITLVVATSKLEAVAQGVLEYFGLIDYFSSVSGAGPEERELKRDILTRALEGSGAPSTKGWMVGDRRFDVDAAIAVGLHPIGALWGYGSRSELTGAGAIDLAISAHELAARLESVTP